MSKILILFILFGSKISRFDGNDLMCYFCDHTESEEAQADDKDVKCMRNFTDQDDYKRLCIGDEICIATVVLRNDAFTEIHRGCDDHCRPECIDDGYGITVKTCQWCCNESLCNGPRHGKYGVVCWCMNNFSALGDMCTSFVPENYCSNSTTDPCPTAVLGHRIACDPNDNYLYVVGGWKSGYVQDNFVRQVWRYNFSTKLWKQLNSDNAPLSLANHTMCKLDAGSRLLVYGGSLLGRDVRGNNNETFIYDTLKQRWEKLITSGDHCPRPSRHWFGQSMFRHSTDLYVATGRREGAGANESSLLIHKLNLYNLQWERLSSPNAEPQGRVRHEIVVYDRHLFVFGGAHCSFDSTYSLDVLPLFDLTSNTWSQITTVPDTKYGYPDSRTCHTCVVYNDNVFVCGGYFIPSAGNAEQLATASRSFDDLWKFHLPTKKWTRLPVSLPLTLWSHAADITSNGRMYVFGGCTKSESKERINLMYKIDLNLPTLELLSWDTIVSSPITYSDSYLTAEYRKRLEI